MITILSTIIGNTNNNMITNRINLIFQWDLVCDRKFLMSMVQPLTQLGILSGNLISGIVADK